VRWWQHSLTLPDPKSASATRGRLSMRRRLLFGVVPPGSEDLFNL
jgi:hypothetical protein